MNLTNPMPGGKTGLPCSCGKEIQEPGLQGWGSLKLETVNYGHESSQDLDPRKTVLAGLSNN
jgi:hypothetical protein